MMYAILKRFCMFAMRHLHTFTATPQIHLFQDTGVVSLSFSCKARCGCRNLRGLRLWNYLMVFLFNATPEQK